MLPILPTPRFFEAGGALGVLGLAIHPATPLPQPVLPPLIQIPSMPALPLSGPRAFAGAYDDVSHLTMRQIFGRRATRPLSSMALADSSSSSSSIAAGQFTKWINGLGLTFSSTTAVVVAPGVCRDSADAAFMQLAAGVTVDYGTTDAIQGLIRKTLTGTCAATTASATVTGTSTLFLTEFGTRAGSGTITGASTTITGTNTKFLSEVAINDLIGTNAKGYARVIAIASDTSLTLAAAIPGGSPAGTAPVIIEQPTVKVGSNTTQQVSTITSDTSLATVANGSAIVSGQTTRVGDVALTPTFCEFLNTWLVSGASGTGCVFSTQRTTPFSLTGYTVSKRRIGAFPLSSAGLILNFTQSWTGSDRFYNFEFALGTNGVRILSAGGATTFTAVLASHLAPPTATMLNVMAFLNAPSGATGNLSLRKRGEGVSTNTRALNARAPAGGVAGNVLLIACDGAQAIDYALAVSVGNVANIDIAGYVESL